MNMYLETKMDVESAFMKQYGLSARFGRQSQLQQQQQQQQQL
jgi:hypothetical protein